MWLFLTQSNGLTLSHPKPSRSFRHRLEPGLSTLTLLT
jgi:hypothetical protein